MVTVMDLSEAERISRERLPEEPAEDWLASWRKAMPKPEAERPVRGLDTAQVDVHAEIRKAADRERTLLTEATGSALGQVRNEVLDEVDAAIEKLRAEFRAETDRLHAEFSQAREVQSLRTELAEIKALLTARSRKAPPPQVPAPSSSALPLADASLAPGLNGNGDAR
jgi:hypothetical protein